MDPIGLVIVGMGIGAAVATGLYERNRIDVLRDINMNPAFADRVYKMVALRALGPEADAFDYGSAITDVIAMHAQRGGS